MRGVLGYGLALPQLAAALCSREHLTLQGARGRGCRPLACWLVVAFKALADGLAKRKLALPIYIAFGKRIFANYAAICRAYEAIAMLLKILRNAQLAIMQHKAEVRVVMQLNAGAFIAVVKKIAIANKGLRSLLHANCHIICLAFAAMLAACLAALAALWRAWPRLPGRRRRPRLGALRPIGKANMRPLAEKCKPLFDIFFKFFVLPYISGVYKRPEPRQQGGKRPQARPIGRALALARGLPREQKGAF